MDIDTTGFELGMPTQVGMLEHQSHMLMAENDDLRTKLAQAQENIQKLVEINQDLNTRASAEFLRANKTHVRLIQIGNRLRCNHQIDITHWFEE